MPIDWTPFAELVRRHRRFLLTTHVRPDGDGLGSMLALAGVLRELGKETRLVITSVFPPRYRFMDPDGHVKRFDPNMTVDAEAVIVLDTGTWNQLDDFGPFLKTFPGPRAVIDHHMTQDDLGALRLVDTTAEATGRLVFEAIRAIGGKLSSAAATNLFTAIAMDTGWFRHSNTTPATFALAAELVAAGAQPEILYERLFEDKSLAQLRLVGLVLDRLQVTNAGRVAFTELHKDDYARTGATPQDSEDLVNYTRSVAGVEVGLFFMEQPRGGVKVSLRSRSTVDVARVAEQFGGGGHQRAAGAVLDGSLAQARARVLETVAAALNGAPA